MANKKREIEPDLQRVIDRKLFEFGQKVRFWRVSNDIGQPEFAELLNLKQSGGRGLVSQIENGKRGLSFAMLVKIADVANFDLELQLKARPENAVQERRAVASSSVDVVAIEQKVEKTAHDVVPQAAEKNEPTEQTIIENDEHVPINN